MSDKHDKPIEELDYYNEVTEYEMKLFKFILFDLMAA